jgi:hypothetical protein
MRFDTSVTHLLGICHTNTNAFQAKSDSFMVSCTNLDTIFPLAPLDSYDSFPGQQYKLLQHKAARGGNWDVLNTKRIPLLAQQPPLWIQAITKLLKLVISHLCFRDVSWKIRNPSLPHTHPRNGCVSYTHTPMCTHAHTHTHTHTTICFHSSC